MATVMARRGRTRQEVGKALNLYAPAGPAISRNGSLALVGTGQGQWLAVENEAPARWSLELSNQLAGVASVSDQSSAYTVFRVQGPRARALLQKGLHIDLSVESFGPSRAATSSIAQIGAVVMSGLDQNTFDVAVFSSFSDSFLDWVKRHDPNAVFS